MRSGYEKKHRKYGAISRRKKKKKKKRYVKITRARQIEMR